MKHFSRTCLAVVGLALVCLGQVVGPPSGLALDLTATAEDLPSSRTLPDMFLMSDGTPVADVDDWQQRRCEMKAIIQHYQYGRVPPRPDRVTAELVRRNPTGAGKVRKSG